MRSLADTRDDRPLLGAQGKGGWRFARQNAIHPSPHTNRDAVILNEADEGGEMKNLPNLTQRY
jgi:hypothetical protein